MSRKITIGVGVLVIHEKRLLVSKRKLYVRPETGRTAGGAGKLAFPGGHVEEGEDYAQTAQREVFEETGLQVVPYPWDGLRYDLHTRHTVESGRNHLTIYVPTVPIGNVVPQDVEPEKHEPWAWHSLPQIQEMVGVDTSWLPLDIMFRYRSQLGL